MNMVWIKDAMSSGMDGALLLGCKWGDDYQCHFVKGSEIANRRMENIGETLGTLGLEPGTLRSAAGCHLGLRQDTGDLDELVSPSSSWGRIPLRGF